MRSLMLVLLATTTLGFTAHANEFAAQALAIAENSITVSGSGKVEAMPDKAEVGMSVITTALSAKEAQAENAKQTKELRTALMNSFRLAEKEIRTVSYTVSPQYSRDNRRTITGYSVTHSLAITTTDLDSLGDILDVSGSAGASSMYIQYGLLDQRPHEVKALQLAMQDARMKADAIAGSVGRSVTGAISVKEANYNVYSRRQDMAEEAEATVIVPDAISVSAELIVEYGF